jgi:plastocyanin
MGKVRMTKTPLRIAAAALLLVLAACGGDDGNGNPNPGPTGPNSSTVDTVRLTGTAFQPANLTVARGRTVVWVNTQPILHTITPDGHNAWNSVNTSSTGEALRVTFNNSGSFRYVCTPHISAGMIGTITVQ